MFPAIVATLAGTGRRFPSIEVLRNRTDRQVMTKGVRLSGRVLSAAGQPIPGARVSESTNGGSCLTYIRHAETDRDGRFHLHFEPKTRVKLTVQVAGFEPVTSSLIARPNQDPIEFRLEPGKVIRGRVLDLAGKPIPGACVFIPRFSRHQGVFLRTWTDLEGRFVWDSAPAGNVEFSIGKDGYLGLDRVAFTAGREETVVILKPGLHVKFQARDSRTHEPIKQFTIETGVMDRDSGMVVWKPELLRSVNDGEFWTTLDATDRRISVSDHVERLRAEPRGRRGRMRRTSKK